MSDSVQTSPGRPEPKPGELLRTSAVAVIRQATCWEPDCDNEGNEKIVVDPATINRELADSFNEVVQRATLYKAKRDDFYRLVSDVLEAQGYQWDNIAKIDEAEFHRRNQQAIGRTASVLIEAIDPHSARQSARPDAEKAADAFAGSGGDRTCLKNFCDAIVTVLTS